MSDVPKLTADRARILAALCGFTDYVKVDQVYASAYGRSVLPGIQTVANLLGLMRADGLTRRVFVSHRNKWSITDLGRAALSKHREAANG